MTTTTTARPASSHIAWAPILWIGGLHVLSLLAFVPAYFSWSALCGSVPFALADRRDRDLHDLSPSADPPQLHLASEMARVSLDDSRHDGVRRGGDRLGCRSSPAPRPLRRGTRYPYPLQGFFWAHMAWWMLVDDGSTHTAEYYKKWAPDLYKDPVHRWIDSYHIIFPLMLFGLLYAWAG